MSTVIIKEFREPGVTQQVTDQTVNPGAHVLLATPVGSLDETMAYSSVLAWITSDSGAILEVVADGLRVSADALGDGLTGGGVSLIEVDIGGLTPVVSLGDTDELMIESGGALLKTTVAEIRSGLMTGVDLGTTPSPTTVVITNTNGTDATLVAAGVNAGLMLPDQVTKLDGIEEGANFGLTAVDLGNDQPQASGVTITNTGGANTSILDANGSRAGVLSAADWARFDAATGAAINLASSPSTTNVVITNTGGDDATILEATGARAGVLSAADWARFDAASGAAIDLGTTPSPTTVVVTNTGGTDATLVAADGVNAGLMLPGQVTKLSGVEDNANEFVLNLSGDATNNSPGQVLTIENDAITTDKILDASVTAAKLENFAGNSILANPGAVPTAPTITARSGITQSAPSPGYWVLGFTDVDDLRIFPTDAFLNVDQVFDAGSTSTSIAINWQTSRRQKLTILDNAAISGFTDPALYDELTFFVEQGPGGGFSLDFSAITLVPDLTIPIQAAPGAFTVLKFWFVGSGIYQWGVQS